MHASSRGGAASGLGQAVLRKQGRRRARGPAVRLVCVEKKSSGIRAGGEVQRHKVRSSAGSDTNSLCPFRFTFQAIRSIPNQLNQSNHAFPNQSIPHTRTQAPPFPSFQATMKLTLAVAMLGGASAFLVGTPVAAPKAQVCSSTTRMAVALPPLPCKWTV